MNTRRVRYPRLNWFARWIGAAVFLIGTFDFIAAGWIGYTAGPGVAGPLVYSIGGRHISIGWFSDYRTNPKSSWVQPQYIRTLSPFERQYWNWQWWPEATLGRPPNGLPYISIPTWAITIVSAAASGISWRVWWKDCRHRRNACVACGYGREGLILGAVCPECGVAPAK